MLGLQWVRSTDVEPHQEQVAWGSELRPAEGMGKRASPEGHSEKKGGLSYTEGEREGQEVRSRRIYTERRPKEKPSPR